MARSVLTPAARARSSMSSRSSANCGKSMCACESINSIKWSVPSAATVGARYIVPLLQSGADLDVFVGETGEDGAAFGADGGGDDHPVGFDAAEFARREIDDDGDFAADQFFRLVVLRDAGANLANLRADAHGELQQLVRADNALGGLDLPDAHLDFGKVLDADFFRCDGRSGSSSATSGGHACGRGRGCRNRRRLFLFFFFHGFHPLDCFLMLDSWKHGFNRPDSSTWLQLTPVKLVDALRFD